MMTHIGPTPHASTRPYPIYFCTSVGGGPRDHHAIFVEKGDDKSGTVYQVTGSMISGFTFEVKPVAKLEDSCILKSTERIGVVDAYRLDEFERVLSAITPPPKQYNGLKRIPGMSARACQDWTADAIAALKKAGVCIPEQE